MARATRRLVLKRDNYRCTHCGAIEDLEVHHIVPRSAHGSNAPTNLTTLCSACHAQLHLADQRAGSEPASTSGRSDSEDECSRETA
ncbi:MAG: HNH endonuclease [Thermomicrobiales bacterium]|nr:HNH endonuclease [Thermomicrobiales bacterium]